MEWNIHDKLDVFLPIYIRMNINHVSGTFDYINLSIQQKKLSKSL